MTIGRFNRTIGEVIFAIGLSLALPAVAAIAGIVGASFLCAKIFSGEAGEWVLVLTPATGLIVGVITFRICFRKIITYGERDEKY